MLAWRLLPFQKPHKKSLRIKDGSEYFKYIFCVLFSRSNEFLAFGGKEVAWFTWPASGDFTVKRRFTASDWIIDISAAGRHEQDLFYILTAHNRVQILTGTKESFRLLRTVTCQEKCILYSGLIVTNQGGG